MPHASRPRRSVLYMPGANQRALEKARTLPADGFIFDLEDAVAPDAKEKARGQVLEAVQTGGYRPRERVVRVNGLDTPWGRDDLRTFASANIDAVLLPKVETAGMVKNAADILDGNGAPDDLAIWCMIETPMGVLNAQAVAGASERLATFVMGTSDLATEMRCLHTPDRQPFLSSLSHCVLVARAYGLAVLDGVHLDLDDEAGFATACRQGRELGFDGKTLIHPKTLAVANETFGPSSDEVDWSHRVIDAHTAAEADGRGVVLVDGKLIENLHVADARRVLLEKEQIDSIAAELAS